MKSFITLLCVFIFTASSVFATPVELKEDKNSLYAEFDKLGTQQVIVATTKKDTDINGSMILYEKVNGQWVKKMTNIPIVVGKKGIGKTKEGDSKAPVGIFPLGKAFGSANKPQNIKVTYTKATNKDYWVDDSSSKDYNKWVNFSGDPKKKWNSFERLTHPLYKYAMVVKYNDNPIVKGKGSAIFLHTWRNSSSPTAGCIGMSEENILKVIQTIDPNKKPMILISKEVNIMSYF